MRKALFAMILAFSPLAAIADAIDTLDSLLRDQTQVQEKVYVHTDNNTYFIGDTLWYKAYVVRADNLQPTDMSKLLYVELLTPDGYLVERQHVVVSGNGHSAGQFVLQDSLYSGYYEIRAYTRWQLNFNVTEKKYSRDDRLKFYGEQACKDFFRNFEGLYSRVVPVYQKPLKAGNYIDRYMAKRPKQRILRERASLNVSFYPEGGHLVQGLPCNVAFEISDHNGQHFDLEGTLSNGQKLNVQHLGKGQFTVTPTSSHLSATFKWNDKTYHFSLPKATETGATLLYDPEKQAATLYAKGVSPAAYAVLCRGRLIDFKRLSASSQIEIPLPAASLPTGINELIVYDSDAQPLASRLFFVNNHDYGRTLDVTLTSDSTEVERRTTLRPYAPVELEVSTPVADAGQPSAFHTFSIAVRDAQTDDPGYDDGNIMTDMLLSSDLKGFIAYPGYYFKADDARHRADLDLLMKVQGWRRYKRVENMRYEPEKTLTFEGSVLKVPSFAHVLELEDLQGVGTAPVNVADQMLAEARNAANQASVSTFSDNSVETTQSDPEVLGIDPDATYDEEVEYADNVSYKLGAGNVRKPVLVEAEIVKYSENGGKPTTAGVVTRTDKYSRFCINIPPFYDKAYFFIKAYDIKDSLTKCMGSVKGSKDMLDERQFPDYFVKRDMFFPIYSQPYTWYQFNSPELLYIDEDDDELIPENSTLAGNHTLQTVIVKARRRGRRGIDRTKPAIVLDAYEAYNNLTDYGLSFGVVDMMRMPMAVATYFLGNMGRPNQFNIRALLDGTTFYRNYTPMASEYDRPRPSTYMYDRLHLNCMKEVRLFTDYEIRVDSGTVVEMHLPDVTIDFVPLDNDAKRYTYRDRRYVLDGVTYPEAFYSPDYSNAVPAEPVDYRRTLYWNPNARPDKDGLFRVRFYNNARETRVTVSAAALDDNGQMYYR